MRLDISTSKPGSDQDVEAAKKAYLLAQITLEEVGLGTSDDDPESGATLASEKKRRKSASFYLSFLSLNIMTFIVSLDATTLSVAIPVRLFPVDFYVSRTYWQQVLMKSTKGHSHRTRRHDT